MLGNFNLPSVDHLQEGVDYWVIDWNFAALTPSASAPAHTPGEPCGPGEKMVFGSCRKLREGTQRDDKDFDSSKKTKQEESLEAEAAKQGSNFQTNKAVSAGGKKYGWAMKDNKPVLVEWGSVAGTKKKQAPAPAKTPSAAGATAIGAVAARTPQVG